MKNKTAFLPKSLNFQALWFLFRPLVKDYRILLPLWFQSAVNPTERETSSLAVWNPGMIPVPGWMGREDAASAANTNLPCSLDGLSQGLCNSFLHLLAWKKERRVHHGDPLQGKLCDLMNLWKRFHFSRLQMVLGCLSCASGLGTFLLIPDKLEPPSHGSWDLRVFSIGVHFL